ncbi:hypothetical protein THIOKS1360001 [Thiocapsa sp. KS1]|nr:hypothetical protein THIOKS1360001 [Thiocapsa sp. KS1]
MRIDTSIVHCASVRPEATPSSGVKRRSPGIDDLQSSSSKRPECRRGRAPPDALGPSGQLKRTTASRLSRGGLGDPFPEITLIPFRTGLKFELYENTQAEGFEEAS